MWDVLSFWDCLQGHCIQAETVCIFLRLFLFSNCVAYFITEWFHVKAGRADRSLLIQIRRYFTTREFEASAGENVIRFNFLKESRKEHFPRLNKMLGWFRKCVPVSDLPTET
ncbi:hypothetical protein CHARACLAT_003243 [Characodon lateralis]|uniref:Uncharacterized protein n=1 Tax=Characodon lateralis TaxID=208331 RepID=A0ABU7DPR4_9TELE|nr:hypothetical protein [Characodon lateralis]